jgi:hypothetical protein
MGEFIIIFLTVVGFFYAFFLTVLIGSGQAPT